MKLRVIISILACLAFLATSIGGFLFKSSLGKRVDEEASIRAEQLVEDIAGDVTSHVEVYLRSLGFISKEKELRKALMHESAEAINNANILLDQIFNSLEVMEACYLMDSEGNTIASSNRNSPKSFVGKNYSFRPYFRNAINGSSSVYMALGVTSNRRGVYYSHPVYVEGRSAPLGVLVLKENVEHLNERLERPYEGIMMITGLNRMVFFSNMEEWLYRPLWKLTPAEMDEVAESRQFGNGPWEWTGVIKSGGHHAFDSGGKEYHLHESDVDALSDWRVSYLHDHEQIIASIGGDVLKQTGIMVLVISLIVGVLVLYLYRLAHNDISMRKKAEAALKESEAKFKTLSTLSPVGIYLTDAEGKCIYVNEKWMQMSGLRLEEALGDGWVNSVHPDDREGLFSDWSRMVESGGEWGKEYRFIKRKGEVTWVYGLATKFIGVSGEVEGYIGVNTDITENKEAEDALKESEERFKAIYDNAMDGILIADVDNKKFFTGNQRMCDMLGYTKEELFLLKVTDIHPEKDIPYVLEQFERQAKGEIKLAGDIPVLRKDGGIFFADINASRLSLRGREYVLGIFRDITERKDFIEKIRDRNKELQQILYTVSHDLRSPLINIQGYSKILEKSVQKAVSLFEGEDISEDIKKKINTIVKDDIYESNEYIILSIRKMDSLLAGLLKLSRTARAELNAEEINMNSLLSDVIRSIDFQIKDSGAVVEVFELPSCYGDEVQINQVFSNLIGNALKFLSPDRKSFIKVSGNEKDGQVVYCVEDNGIGIPSGEQEKIFEVFYQADPESSQGEGLGLSVVSKILERHNGKIWVESEEGKGSRFYVALPLKRS